MFDAEELVLESSTIISTLHGQNWAKSKAQFFSLTRDNNQFDKVAREIFSGHVGVEEKSLFAARCAMAIFVQRESTSFNDFDDIVDLLQEKGFVETAESADLFVEELTFVVLQETDLQNILFSSVREIEDFFLDLDALSTQKLYQNFSSVIRLSRRSEKSDRVKSKLSLLASDIFCDRKNLDLPPTESESFFHLALQNPSEEVILLLLTDSELNQEQRVQLVKIIQNLDNQLKKGIVRLALQQDLMSLDIVMVLFSDQEWNDDLAIDVFDSVTRSTVFVESVSFLFSQATFRNAVMANFGLFFRELLRVDALDIHQKQIFIHKVKEFKSEADLNSIIVSSLISLQNYPSKREAVSILEPLLLDLEEPFTEYQTELIFENIETQYDYRLLRSVSRLLFVTPRLGIQLIERGISFKLRVAERPELVTGDERLVLDLLVSSIYRGDIQILENVFGQNIKRFLKNTSFDYKFLNSTFSKVIEEQWSELDPSLESYLGMIKTEDTNDPQSFESLCEVLPTNLFYKIYFQNSLFFEARIERMYSQKGQIPDEYRALIANYENFDSIEEVIETEEFQTEYPDYFEKIKSTHSLGERALWYRAACGQIDIKELEELLIQVKEWLPGIYGGSTIVTALHCSGIYLERYLDRDIHSLLEHYQVADLMRHQDSTQVTIDSLSQYLYRTDGKEILAVITKVPESISIENNSENERRKLFFRIIASVVNSEDQAVATRLFGYSGEDIIQLFFETMDSLTEGTILILFEYFDIDVDFIVDYLKNYKSDQGYRIKLNMVLNAYDVFKDELHDKVEFKSVVVELWHDVLQAKIIYGDELDFFDEYGLIEEKDLIVFFNTYLRREDWDLSRNIPYEKIWNKISDESKLDIIMLFFDNMTVVDLKAIGSIASLLQLSEVNAESQNKNEIIRRAKDLIDIVSDITQLRALVEEIDLVLENPFSVVSAFLMQGKFNERGLNYFLEERVFPGCTPEEIKQLFILYLENDGNKDIDSLKLFLETVSLSEDELVIVFEKIIKRAKPQEIDLVFDFLRTSIEDSESELSIELVNVIVRLGTDMTVLNNVPLMAQNYWRGLRKLSYQYNRSNLENDPYNACVESVIAEVPELSICFSSLGDLLPDDQMRSEGFMTRAEESYDVSERGVQMDSRGFYRSNILFGMARGTLDDDEIRQILGDDLFAEFQGYRLQIAQKVKGQQFDLMQHVDVLGSSAMLFHGVGEAENKERVENSLTVSGGRETVQAIVGGKGISIAGEKATVGAFVSFGSTGYGSYKNGTTVMIFTEEASSAHTAFSSDPNLGDGLLARDVDNGKYIGISSRLCLNPQENVVDGVELNDEQMTNFLASWYFFLEQNPEFVQRVESSALQHESNIENGAFLIKLRKMHQKLRKEGYSEAVILTLRDRYTELKLSLNNSDKKLGKLYDVLIQAGDNTIELKATLDALEFVWSDQDGREELENTIGSFANARHIEKIIQVISGNFQVLQRRELLGALNDLREPNGQRAGVLAQLDRQREFAPKSKKWSFSHLYDLNKDLFVGARTDGDTKVSLRKTERLSDYITQMKVGVLKSSYLEAKEKISTTDKAVLRKYKKKVSVCASGSVARGEVVLSSDIDYLILVDDSDMTVAERDVLLSALRSLSVLMNEVLAEDFLIRPDAGLANLSAQPIILSSELSKINIRESGRQVVEPSELFDLKPIDRRKTSRQLIEDFQQKFAEHIIETDQLETMSGYFHSDWQGYMKHYVSGLGQLENSDVIIDVKQQFARAIQFFIMTLWANSLPEVDWSRRINTTDERIQILQQSGVLTVEEAQTISDTLKMLYKYRYRGDVMSSALITSKSVAEDKKPKIKARMDPNYLSPHERSSFIKLVQSSYSIMNRKILNLEETKMVA